jgi:hypothetical protein
MKKYIILFLFLIAVLKTNAQVVLTMKDVPPLGTNIIFANITDTLITNNFRFGKTGTNNIWDFSKLGLNYIDTAKFLNPKSSIYYNRFEDCKYAIPETNGLKSVEFFKYDSSGIYSYGFSGFYEPYAPYQARKYKHPTPILKFPTSFQRVYSDSNYQKSEHYSLSEGDSNYNETYFYFSREIVATGKIKLPFGEFESILLKLTGESIDTTWSKNILTGGKWTPEVIAYPSKATFYEWYCNHSTYFVARILGHYEYPISVDNQDMILVQMNNYANLKSLSSENVNNLNISIYPNPANNKLYIESNNVQQANYSITNMFGQQIAEGKLITEIDITSLINGVYFLKITTASNATKTVKFIKH